MTVAGPNERQALLRRGFALEYTTLGWNVAGIVVVIGTSQDQAETPQSAPIP